LTEEPTFEEMFAGCRESAVHLEMRDAYTPDDPIFLDWKAGKYVDILSEWRDWYDLMVATTGRGVRVRRVRVVSEPITDFIRHEYESTGLTTYGSLIRTLSVSAISAGTVPILARN
jgi:hypothetical protein